MLTLSGVAMITWIAGASVSAPANYTGVYFDANQDYKAQLPKSAVPLWAHSDVSKLVTTSKEGIATWKTGPALTFIVQKTGANGYDAEVKSPLFDVKTQKGDVVFFVLTARALPDPLKKQGVNSLAAFGVHLQQTTPIYKHFGGKSTVLNENWSTNHYSFTMSEDSGPNQSEVTLHLAAQRQTVEIKSFRGYNLGPNFDTSKLPINVPIYLGQEPTAKWRKVAEKNIDLYRKADIKVRIVDEKRNPIRGAKVMIRMKKHEYPFGSFTDESPSFDNADGVKSREEMEKIFNRITVPIYWADWGWESENSREWYTKIYDWATKKGIRMRAHTLLYPGWQFFPSRIKALENDPVKFREAVLTGTDERIAFLKKYDFEVIDVVNELVTCTDVDRIAGPELVHEMFRKARKAWPKAKLVYNDFDIFENAIPFSPAMRQREQVYDRLIAAKVPLDQWGWQGHFGESLIGMEDTWKVLDYFAKKYKKPIEITEFDVNTKNEEVQAAYTRDLLTAWFSHPATNGFTMWGFWEGSIWIPEGAMIRKDWTKKPNYLAWLDLTQRKWWTNADLTTNKEGITGIRGFKGDYEVTVETPTWKRTFQVKNGDKGFASVVGPRR